MQPTLTDGDVEALARRLAEQLVGVPGVVAVAMGGSRARGSHLPTSDLDLGVYYATGLDLAVLEELARAYDAGAGVAGPGEWGPWVDGGCWMSVDGQQVDLILRSLARVEQQVEGAVRGQAAFHPQAGHPLGFLDVSYAGELALGRVLADPSGRLSALREQVVDYPPALGTAMEGMAWEADFCLDLAVKGAAHEDVTYAAQCVSRAVLLAAHAMMARAGQWVVNEKGLVRAAGRLPDAPDRFEARVADVMEALGRRPSSVERAVSEARTLLGEALGDGAASSDD